MHDPERYESNKSAASRDADLHVPQIIKRMSWGRNETILDYGCGAGSTGNKFILPKAEELDSNIKAVDISEEMIAHANDKFSHTRVAYAVGNILENDFPFSDVKFDRIFAVYVFHFIKEYKDALKRFYNLLKPGGQFGFTVLTKSSIFKFYQQTGISEKWAPYVKGYEKFVPEWFEKGEDAEASFREALESNGYKILELTTHKQSYFFADLNTLLELYVSLNPFASKIPLELKDEFKEEYRRLLASIYSIDTNSKSISTNYEMITAVVEKPL